MANDNKGVINYGSIGGDATVTHENRNHGDSINVTASHSHVQVTTASPGPVSEMRELLEQLRVQLRELPMERSSDGERLVAQVDAMDRELDSAQPEHGMLKVTAEGIRKAAEFVADVAPGLLETALRIARLL